MLIIGGQQRRDLITGCLLLVLSGTLFWASGNIRDFASVGVGADFFPFLTAFLFLLVGATLVVSTWWKRSAKPSAEIEENERNVESGFGGTPAVMVSIALMLGYLYLLSILGFILSSIIYIFLQIQILVKRERRRHFLFFIIASFSSLLSFFLFYYIFDISLPVGMMG